MSRHAQSKVLIGIWGCFLFDGKTSTLVAYPSQRTVAEITKFHPIMMEDNEENDWENYTLYLPSESQFCECT